MVLESGFQLGDALAVARHTLGAGDEHVRNRLVTMDVEEQVDAGFAHLGLYAVHLGAAFQAGRQPLAIQVGTGGIGAQIAAHRAVRVHVRNDVEGGMFEQDARNRVLPVEQTAQQAFGKPFGHGFARVLAGDDPDLQVGRHFMPDRQQVDVATIDGGAEVGNLAEAGTLRLADQVEVAFPAIRLEVGVVDAVGQRCVLDGHDVAVVAGRHAEPVDAVVRRAQVVVFPAGRIGGFPGIEEAHHTGLVGRPLQTKVEPLSEFRCIVGANLELNIVKALRADDFDTAGVELCADFHGVVR